jgi:hypothetical protein
MARGVPIHTRNPIGEAIALKRESMNRNILAAVVIAITASPSRAEHVPVTCEQFIASMNDSPKGYEAPPVAVIGKPLAYGDFKDSKLKMFPDVYIGLSCLNGHLDSFEVMPETREVMAAVHAGFTMGIALHAFGLDWKTGLNMRDEMVRKMSTDGRAQTIVEGATIRLYRGVTGIPVFQIEYPDPPEPEND